MKKHTFLGLLFFVVSGVFSLDEHNIDYRTQVIEDSVGALIGSAAVQCFSRYKMADAIPDVGISTSTLSKKLCSRGTVALEQVLGIMQFKGYLEKKGNLWSLTAKGHILRSDHPYSMQAYGGVPTQAWWNSLYGTDHTVATGEPSFFKLYGNNFFELEGNGFAEGMAAYSRMEEPWIASQLTLDSYARIVDIGGGLGGLARNIKQVYPDHKVTLLDLPHVIKEAKTISENSGLFFQEADFTKSIPVQADAFFLKRVLLDWSDSDAVKILKKLKKRLKPGGRIFLIDALLDDPENGQKIAKFSLLMNVFFGAHHRTRNEVEMLINKAGLEVVSSTLTPFEVVIIELKGASL